jgi:hypothetical protein
VRIEILDEAQEDLIEGFRFDEQREAETHPGPESGSVVGNKLFRSAVSTVAPMKPCGIRDSWIALRSIQTTSSLLQFPAHFFWPSPPPI